MVAGLAFCVQQIQKGSFYGHITTRQAVDESRQEALRSGATLYAGQACAKCGCSVRYTSNNGCRDCQLKRQRDRRLAAMKYEGVPIMTSKQASEARKQAKAEGKYHYNGRPCYRCGETLRQVSTSSCVACDRERKAKR